MTGTVQISQGNTGPLANGSSCGLVQTHDRGHPALCFFARFLHKTSALAHEPQAVLEIHRSGGCQGGEFPQRQTCRRVERQRRCLLFEQLKCDPAHEKNSRLGIFSLEELGFGAVETNRRQVVANGPVGAVKPVSGGRKLLREIAAHAGDLRALTRK